MIVLQRFPMPPTANHLYSTLAPRPGKKFGARTKSKYYLAFLRSAQTWAMINHHEVRAARDYVSKCKPGRFLRIDCQFHFLEREIFTKEYLPRKNDTSNRTKALHDALSDILHIDDSYFWTHSGTKVIGPMPGVTIVLEHLDV